MAKDFKTAAETSEGICANEQITAKQVRLINKNGENVGVVQINDALQMAIADGLDLLEISPNAEPPVCKIMDLGKYKYEEQKKKNEARKKQKVISVKELKFRPAIDEHDFEVKIRAARKFLGEGDKVKITMRFRGRELSNPEFAMEVMDKIKLETEDVAKVELEPKMEGKQMLMILVSAKG